MPTKLEPTNLDRAKWAGNALKLFRLETGCDREDSLTDLLTDLMHWATAKNLAQFDLAVDVAKVA